jgi:hypothetical protein
MRWNGFSVNVIESKAVFSPKIGRYMSSMAVPGLSDLVGCDKNGLAVFVELKAVGRKSNVSDKQKAFLTEKIKCNAFAVVTDSASHLRDLYEKFCSIITKEERQKYLLDLL